MRSARKRAAMALGTLTLAVGGTLLAPAVANAYYVPVDGSGGSSSDCYYNNARYSEGSVVYMGPVSKTCMSGRWV